LVSVNVIQTNWFPKKKALVLGVSTIGFPLCTMVFPALSNFLIGKVGLEGMFTVIAIIVAVFAVICIFVCKVTPEEAGKFPDNEPLGNAEFEQQKKEMENYQSPWTIKKLIGEKMFWFANIGLGLMWMVTIAIVSQLVSRLMSAGYEQTQAVAMLSVMGFFGIFGSYIWGWIDQKFGTKKAALIYCGWYAIALLLLIFMSNTVSIYLAIFMVGTSVGGICNLIPSMTGTIFGRKDFAAANRLASPVTTGIKACAFLYVAQSLRLTGDLTGAYIGLIVVCGIAALLISRIKPLTEK
jgi:sugar phosphate permease